MSKLRDKVIQEAYHYADAATSKEIADVIIPMIINECIEAVKKEPETINSSSSCRHGYARCSRDNEQALEELKK